MKDQFGNDIYINATDKNDVQNDAKYNDNETGVTDLQRNNLDNGINIQGNSAYSNKDMYSTDGTRNDLDRVLVGIFDTVNEANNVINRLKEIGYDEKEITVIAKDKDKMDRLEGDTNNMGKGAAIGGTLGGLAAALPALGVLAIPGIGPILAAGPIAVILGGVVAGGVAGGLIGALTEMGVSSANAKDYEYQLDQGKIIVLVDNNDNMHDEVYSIYNQNNSLTNKNATKY